MEAKPVVAAPVPDYLLNEALGAPAEEELDGLSIRNQRLARVQEYEEVAVSRSDPFAAIIGMGTASLQRVFDHLGAAIVEKLDSHAHTIAEVRELSPEIRLLVKLRNAIEKDLEVQDAVFPHGSVGKGLDAKVGPARHGLLPKSWGAK